MVKAKGLHFDFGMFAFKAGREGKSVQFCNALLLLEHRWEAEVQDPM